MREWLMAGIHSEVGALQTVLVHRPDLEIDRITPGTKDELLFDELVWLEQAQAEHDAFTRVLSEYGAEVLHVAELLTELFADEQLAAEVVSEHVTYDLCGIQLAERIRSYLAHLPPSHQVRSLIGGITYEEVGETGGLVAALRSQSDFILPPLPNMVFTRDSSVWIGEGVILCPMNRIVRRRETGLLRVIYKNHPRFSGSPIWFGSAPGETFPATVEGGDVLVLTERGLAIGISERTTSTGAASLASRLFESDAADRILAVELPVARTTMHLDTVVSMVDQDAFLIYPKIRPGVRTVRITPGRENRLDAQEGTDLVEDLAWAAGLEEAQAIEPPLDSVRAEREQWNDANNTFAVAPGTVVAYERNVATNEVLQEAGVKVETIPSYELPRGRGGPRCMTCPVSRSTL